MNFYFDHQRACSIDTNGYESRLSVKLDETVRSESFFVSCAPFDGRFSDSVRGGQAEGGSQTNSTETVLGALE